MPPSEAGPRPKYRPILVLSAIFALLAGLALWQLAGGPGAGTGGSTLERELEKARLVDRMRTDLYAAAEAEKNAHMAETDELSQNYAQRARAALHNVADSLSRYRPLVAGRPGEAALLDRVDAAFAEFRKVDEEVLALAVQNTNLKALALSFGPASKALDDMERALAPLAQAEGKGGPTAQNALRALLAAQRIQALHAPHILEKTEAHMAELEQRMAQADKEARKALAALGSQAGAAAKAYEAHHQATEELLRLSRLNTNVRSLALSLERTPKALAACDEALLALKQHQSESLTKATR